MKSDLKVCCYNSCNKNATTEGFVYGRYQDSTNPKDKFIEVVACDKHAKENDFYPKDNESKS
ncbi:hypothetical protein ABE42_41065 [Bacillus thuringiensis]|uniref:Uncharacterized protein n=1 Tax=Bacillus thuringiensis TaxID=1428 RepID=A0A437SN41_BACTU|nr:hypothetical protein [Bacillus thuringiensis]MBG9538592.1 hypothetical protein [Bacillus thuringiensis]MBG9585425.1 hypothetical protein [Bacillus thuringiensis]RVU64652.1 hypothetical protein BM74_08430 [Bacillus thuringiensis]